MQFTSDTIAAQATPPGRGGVGIIRVSGPGSFLIAQTILNKTPRARHAHFCNFFSHDQKVIDQGLVIYFSAPHSFTGEDVLELHGHGGQAVMDLLLQRVLELGARLARPGEFMERAFLNRKLDLVQAEAVADLINAATSQAAQNAARSLVGKFSCEINKIVAQLIEVRAQIEAAIDFVEEEDVLEIDAPDSSFSHDAKRWSQLINTILPQVAQLKSDAMQGVILREGVTVVIVGNPNAGKSSLLNCLSGQDTAIVTDIPGTTRDVLRTWIQIDGLPIHVLDTAGLHEQPDVVEQEGIRRAWEEIKKADHVLLMVDAAAESKCAPDVVSEKFLKTIPGGSKLTVLYNKIDLTKEAARIEKINNIDCLYLSVKTGAGINLLQKHLKESAGLQIEENVFGARRRHVDSLARAEKALQNAERDLARTTVVEPVATTATTIELIAEELKQAQRALGEITGEVTTEDLLGKIFSEFCVGK